MEFQVKLVSLHFISAILIGIVSSYPTYVPNSPDVCSKMTPGHGPRPQTTPAPFQILLNKQSMTGGNNLQITIRGKKGRKFKGFYIQVRDIDGIPLGTFLSPDENEAGTHGCFNQKNNAIHHKNRNDKDSITVYWKAPEDHEGKVRVLGTIVKDFETYWTNVQAAEPVSISNTSAMIFKPSPPFPEKAEKETPKLSKANGILNYNPYSPFPPLSSWDRMDIHIENSSSDFLLRQPSEQSSVAQERQLVGPTSFDFHGGLYTSKMGGLKSKSHYPPPSLPHHYHHHPHLPSSPHGPSSINEQLPPLPNHHHHHNSIESQSRPPPSNSLFQRGPRKPEVKERHPSYPFQQTPLFPAIDSPYQFHFPDSSNDIQKNPVRFTPSKHPDSFGFSPHQQQQPHFTQSVFDKNGHHIVNHHYISPNTPTIQQPFHYPHHQLHHHLHKPASDPSYPNSGYFPKDILTRLTSYIPNIYNAITNNPLFNFNVDNTIESIWKPSKGIPPQKHHSILTAASTPPKVDMPKYGYLVYNPVRGNPYYVIPAMNEDEFVANHMSQR